METTLEILVQKEHFNVCCCAKNRRVGLHFGNFMAVFYPQEFISWANSVMSIDFGEKSCLFPDGQYYLTMNTCHPDLQLCFRQQEFEIFTQGLCEALLLLQAMELTRQW